MTSSTAKKFGSGFLTTLLIVSTLTSANGHWFSFPNPTTLPKHQDDGAAVSLPFKIPLFGKTWTPGTSIWISANGYLSFGEEVKRFKKVTYPAADSDADPTLIAPFRARMQYRPDESDNLASVTYSQKLSKHGTDKLNTLIRTNVPEASYYSSKHILAVSWNNISFYGGDPGATPYPRNSFQVIISTNGSSAFAIFYYKHIVWTGGHANGGNSKTGVGADNPSVQAGMNIGKGKGFVNIYDGKNILDLDIEQGSGGIGQYIYEISKQHLTEHGCGGKYPDSVSVQLKPTSGHMYGGNPVEVSAVCFKPQQTIKCQFGDQIVKAEYLSPTKVLCYVPTFYANKQQKFRLIVDGKVVKGKGHTSYLSSNGIKAPISLIDTDNWRSLKPWKDLLFKWDPSMLSRYKGLLNVKLFTYRENATYYNWHEELTIEEGVANTGSYSFNSSTLRCSTNCRDKTIGAIVLELADTPDESNPGRLWSKIGPLGWYVNSHLTSQADGHIWPDKECYNWFVKETKEGSDWLEELEDCPCTKQQAVADIGRFIADPGCNMYNKNSSYNCYYHSTAEHCVRSIWPSKPTGAGTQCCYGADNSLIYAGDSIYGSTVDKSHNDGALPYDAPGLVPGLSHWLLDVITYQYCCLWNRLNNTCDIYMDLRPTKDCNKYQTIKSAAIYGGLHVKTLAAKGHVKLPSLDGEYMLLKSTGAESIHVHVQLTPIPKKSISVVSAVGITSSNSSKVKVVLAKGNHGLRSKIVIDGIKRDFTDPAWFKQEYQGVKVISWNEQPITDHSNFTITLESGVGVRVSVGNHHLNVLVTVPKKLQDKLESRALFGAWKKRSEGVMLSDAFLMPGHSMFTAEDKPKFSAEDISAEDMTSQTAESASWIDTLEDYSAPVTSCGMPVFHGTRRGNKYTQGSTVEVVSCRHGYDLVNGTKGQQYTCSSNGKWEPKVTAACAYSGFPEFSPTKGKTTLASKTHVRPTGHTKIHGHNKTTPRVIATARSHGVTSTTTITTAQASNKVSAIKSAERTKKGQGFSLPAKEDYGGLAAILVVTGLVIFIVIMAGLVYRNRKSQQADKQKYMNVRYQDDEIDYVNSTIVSAKSGGETGGLKVLSVSEEFLHTQETDDFDPTLRMKSYRVAVDENNQLLEPADKLKSYRVAVATHDQNHGPENSLKSYRVAVDSVAEGDEISKDSDDDNIIYQPIGSARSSLRSSQRSTLPRRSYQRPSSQT